ncbi:MAG: hypothetical protein ACQEVA_13440 [Myxococcota bacterium]
MSHFDADNLSFFDTIQIFFTQLTGRGVMLGGRDIEYLDRLRAEGVDARMVCRAIAEAVEQMPDDDPPRNVFACRPWIDSHLERVRAGSAGAHTESPEQEASDDESSEAEDEAEGEAGGAGRAGSPQPLLEDALASIESAGKDARSEAIRQVYREAWRQVRELMDDAVSNPFEELAAVEDALVAAYFEALADDERERLEKKLEQEHAPHLQRMTEEARRRHLRARKRKALMESYGLVSLLD